MTTPAALTSKLSATADTRNATPTAPASRDDANIASDEPWCDSCGAGDEDRLIVDIHRDGYDTVVGFATCDNCGHYYDEPIDLARDEPELYSEYETSH